ncbi:MAG: DUF1326 domain-containing protein [bacterium]
MLPVGLAAGEARSRTDSAIVEGVWSDACPCAIPCSCWSSGSPNVAYCSNIQVYVLRSGQHKGVAFKGNVFVVAHSSRSAWAAPSLAALYLDHRLEPIVAAAIHGVVS